MENGKEHSLSVTRRTFIKTTSAATAGLMASGNYAFGGTAAEEIKVGLIGCGGRGTGAIINSMSASPMIKLVAMGDVFPDRIASSKERIIEAISGDDTEGRSRTQFAVTEENMFSGFDAYQKVIAADVDMIILATPPAFRPTHIRATIEAGKHLFTEKPVGVDPAGIRSVLESSAMAKEKGLSIVAGTQRRHDLGYREIIDRIHNGDIGEPLSGEVYWNQGGLWVKERKAGWTDMEWQLRNWLYFTWLSGDHVVEQHIHNIDVANWVMQGPPVRAHGVGGRQVRVSPAYGHIFDHFAVQFEYANGARVLSMCKQQDGTASRVNESFIGTKGTSNAATMLTGAKAHELAEKAPNPYVQEHVHLVKSIVDSQGLNEGKQVAESTLSAIMAREACYTGQVIEWDEIMNADLDLTPSELAFGPMPVPPVPAPGITTLDRLAVAQ